MKKDKTRNDLNLMVSGDDVTDSLGSPSASMSGISSPNYMRDTTSSSARKAKFRAISDSILSSSATTLKLPDTILSEKTWSVSGCSYSYCSLHGHQHQHHASAPPLKEFISAKKLVNNQKDKKLREGAAHTTSVTKRDQSRQKVSIETHKAQAVHFAREEEDTGLDFHVTTVAKLRTEGAAESGDPSHNSAATPRKKSHPAVNTGNNLKHLKGRQKALHKDLQESHLEERGTTEGNIQKEPADAIPLPVNPKGNKDTVSESSQLSNELAVDRDSQDICQGSTPSLAKEHALRGEELQGDKSFDITVIPSVATCTSQDKRGGLTEVSCEDEQGIPTDKMEVLGKQLVGHCHQATEVAIKTSMPEGNHNAQSKTFTDKEEYTSLWDLDLQDVETDLVEKGEMQLSDKTDTEGITNNCSEFSPEEIHDKGMDIQAPTSFEFHEDEAIKLVEEAINELLTLPEQARDNLFSSTCRNSEEAVWDEVVENCRDASFPKEETKEVETSMNIFSTLEDVKASPRENLSNIYSKFSKVIMCRRFIEAMNKMRQLKLKPPQERQHTSNPEAEETPSLHHTEIGDKKSWQEWMLDYALQQVVSKLAPAQRKRVALLVQAFEIVSSQPKQSNGQRRKEEMP